MPYTMKINGSLVNVVQGTLDVVNQIGQRSTGTVQVWSSLGTFWSYGTQVQVYDQNSVLQYAGFTSKDKVSKFSRQGQGFLEHQITLMDNCYKADKRLVFGSWLNVSAGSIVNDMLTRYLAAEGITTLPGSIATGATIAEVIWNGKQISSALTWLSTQCGYWWNIDTAGVLWFQPYAGVSAPFVLDGTQVNVDSNLSVTFGNDLYVNRQFVKGAFAATGTLTETFNGNNMTRSFTLSYEVSSITSITLNGTPLTLTGTSPQVSGKGSSGALFYYAVGDAVIAQDPGQTLLQNTDTLVVVFKGRFPVLALAQSGPLIAAQKAREGGGTGWVENEFVNTKVHTLPAAGQIANALLAHYGQDMTQLEFNTLTPGLQEGQMLKVNLSDFGLSNTQMLITSVEISDSINENFNIWFHVTAVGSPYDASQWQTYWQSLMNQSSDPTDLQDVDDAAGLAYLFSSTVSLSGGGQDVATNAFLPTTMLTADVTLTKTTCPIVPFTIPATLC
jgi:hypothetical protein